MIKRFCDLCGKGIKGVPNTISVAPFHNKQELYTFGVEMCDKCDEKLMLKIENNKMYFLDLLTDSLNIKRGK